MPHKGIAEFHVAGFEGSSRGGMHWQARVAPGYGVWHKGVQVHSRGNPVTIRSGHVKVKSTRPGVGVGSRTEPTTGQTEANNAGEVPGR